MIRQQINEIARIKSLMGFNVDPILETRKLIKKLLIEASVGPRQELADLVRRFFMATDEDAAKMFNTLSEEEKIYLKSLAKSSDELGGAIGDLSTAAGVSSLRKFMSESGNDVIKRTFAKAEREISRRLAGLDVQRLISMDQDVAYIIRNTPLSRNIKIGKKNATLIELLQIIETQNGVKNSKLFDTQPEMWAVLADDIGKVADNAPDNVKSYLGDIQEEIFERLNPEDYVEVLAKEEDEIIQQMTDEQVELIKKDVLPPVEIDFDVEEVIQNPDLDLTERQLIQKEFITKLEDSCTSRPCRLMKNLYNKNPKKFDRLWNNIENEFLEKFKVAGNIDQAAQDAITNYDLILKKLNTKTGKKLTPQNFEDMSTKVFESLKGSNAWIFNPKSSVDWRMYMTEGEWKTTLLDLFLGKSLVTGQYGSFKDMFKRWIKFNMTIFAFQFLNKLSELNEGPKPGETSGDQMIRIAGEVSSDLVPALLGVSPVLRLGMETITGVIDYVIDDTAYVSEADLREYLKETHGWDAISVDKFILHPEDNMTYVKYYQTPTDDSTPRTEVSGVTITPYNAANGTYTMDRSGSLGLITQRVSFIPQGATKPLEPKKDDKISKEFVEAVRKEIAINSVISKFIKDKTLGGVVSGKEEDKKDISFIDQGKVSKDGKEQVTLNFKYKNISDEEYTIYFLYDEWVNANKPTLNTDTVFDTYVRFK
jgi:hypothetical protein